MYKPIPSSPDECFCVCLHLCVNFLLIPFCLMQMQATRAQREQAIMQRNADARSWSQICCAGLGQGKGGELGHQQHLLPGGSLDSCPHGAYSLVRERKEDLQYLAR